ncbi:hypothetical protein PN419_00435 [Halorubrum ezzemoulense]|uniref:hypothetical protein n=1 Tax=Halorubrum ezzemoulense TaxID=337243 RepID=UPI002330DE6A|nr:hypothetical protein [Halorubrum ezzemoulense]MDB9247474.1 hypothetical protein [Halorubrum ezzemoulense]MDB9258617.1 hypothetical protein [Halorubrum ezzemoulense]MDB9264525.1 hypothetical protein [Halorubrum ezzemoulense]MDB9268978.1 hypothetical protein [Halorubrum ezzemoulense]MDB9271493.1 hypothetical protein [Halorubrum ezzemoulense]
MTQHVNDTPEARDGTPLTPRATTVIWAVADNNVGDVPVSAVRAQEQQDGCMNGRRVPSIPADMIPESHVDELEKQLLFDVDHLTSSSEVVFQTDPRDDPDERTVTTVDDS